MDGGLFARAVGECVGVVFSGLDGVLPGGNCASGSDVHGFSADAVASGGADPGDYLSVCRSVVHVLHLADFL